jgi:membrane-associated PAP2 superfamily phosphatase
MFADAEGAPRPPGVAESPTGSVVVRSRDYATRSLWAYLQSRSRAGCTADDLVAGAHTLSGGACVAAFFPTGPSPPRGLSAWLGGMIAAGAAAIATMNTQLDGADYWHHQAVRATYSLAYLLT